MLCSEHMKTSTRVPFGFISLLVACFLAFSAIPVSAETPIQEGGAAVFSPSSIDFGVKNVGLLPISPLYFLKEWRRDIVRAMTTSPYADTLVELQILNEKAAETQKVAEFRPGDESSISRALETYGSSLVRVGHAIEYLSTASPKNMTQEFLSGLVSESRTHFRFFSALEGEYGKSKEITDILGGFETKLTDLSGKALKGASADVVSAVLSTEMGSSTEITAGSFMGKVASEVEFNFPISDSSMASSSEFSTVVSPATEGGDGTITTGTEYIAPTTSNNQ